ncbi:hypothetical protein (plasmid) [Lactobacillus brevis] [Lactiplantibacillus mudanjiangensis]|uniref:phage neck terminator protein n=1 Tax=Lactiplantibacillus mudanjiangensis TaxID=1296538 RepID=UPI0010158F58|nr:hypothetical protein [Lactiplantibacillus mudanjiangensis]VDG31408.1 hypothetical protein (plasmid) [Lactobacillus brevis] [Lactiplantibacillus mudanjiangensis]
MSSWEDNLYDRLAEALIEQIHKYEPDLVVTAENVVATNPAFPYVEYDIYDDGTAQTFENMNNEPLLVGVQMKAVSNLENEAKAIAQWLSKVFREAQPATELMQQGIGVKRASPLPPTVDFLTSDYIFTSGTDLQIEILDGFQDNTQPGQIQTVKPNIQVNKGDLKHGES